MQTTERGYAPDLLRTAVLLSWFTIAYNCVEGLVSIYLGVDDGSVALAGFGADSFIEVASAVLVLWRFRGESGQSEALSEKKERRATFGIGVLFLLLGLGTAGASSYQLLQHSHPETTLPGLVVSGLSLSFMFFLWRAKQKVGRALESRTVLKDADCSRACIQLSGVLFLGSMGFLLMPFLWWADSVAALILSVLILKEGVETVNASRSEDFSGGCGCG